MKQQAKLVWGQENPVVVWGQEAMANSCWPEAGRAELLQPGCCVCAMAALRWALCSTALLPPPAPAKQISDSFSRTSCSAAAASESVQSPGVCVSYWV